MYLLVSLLQLNALVAGNGSYILRPCGHDLHGPTLLSWQGGGGATLSYEYPVQDFWQDVCGNYSQTSQNRVYFRQGDARRSCMAGWDTKDPFTPEFFLSSPQHNIENIANFI